MQLEVTGPATKYCTSLGLTKIFSEEVSCAMIPRVMPSAHALCSSFNDTCCTSTVEECLLVARLARTTRGEAAHTPWPQLAILYSIIQLALVVAVRTPRSLLILE
jgi:hypothetical protein